MKKEADKGNKPHRAIMPLDVPKDKMWDLDVDDPIWNDVGLGWSEPGAPLDNDRDGDGEEGIQIPRWMGDDGIRRGMHALALRDRGREEKIRLSLERDALESEAREVWNALTHLLEVEEDPDYLFQWQYRRQRTLHTIIGWSNDVVAIPSGTPEAENWGPEFGEMMTGVGTLVFGELQGEHFSADTQEVMDEVEAAMEEGNPLVGVDYALEDIVVSLGLLDAI